MTPFQKVMQATKLRVSTSSVFFDEWNTVVVDGAETRQPEDFDDSVTYYYAQCDGCDYRANNLNALMVHWANHGARKLFKVGECTPKAQSVSST